jgi:hypothetical protein
LYVCNKETKKKKEKRIDKKKKKKRKRKLTVDFFLDEANANFFGDMSVDMMNGDGGMLDDDIEDGYAAIIDDQWSKLTDMYLNLTLDDDDDDDDDVDDGQGDDEQEDDGDSGSVPAVASSSLPMGSSTTVAALPTISSSSTSYEAIFSPSKSPAAQSPVANGPPGFAPPSAWQQSPTSTVAARLFQQSPSTMHHQPATATGVFSLDQIEQQQQCGAGAVAVRKTGVFSLDQIEQQAASAGSGVAASPIKSGVFSLDQIEQQQRQQQRPDEAEPVKVVDDDAQDDDRKDETKNAVAEHGNEKENKAKDTKVVKRQHKKKAAAPPKPYEHVRLPTWSTVKRDGERMSAANMNYVLKMQRLGLMNSPNLFVDDYYNQTLQRERILRDASRKRLGYVPVSVDHVPLCDTTLPPVVRRVNTVDFSATLGKISVSSLHAPRQLMEAVEASSSDDDDDDSDDDDDDDDNDNGDDGQSAGRKRRRDRRPHSQVIFNGAAFKRYEALMVLENACSIVIEIEDIDTVLKHAGSSMRRDRRHHLVRKRIARTKKLFSLLRVFQPVDPNVAPFSSGGQYCFPEDAALFSLLRVDKGKRVVARAIAVMPLDLSLCVLLLFARNWGLFVTAATTSTSAGAHLSQAFLQRILTLPVLYVASLLQTMLFFNSTPQRLIATVATHHGAHMFATSLKRVYTIRVEEMRAGAGADDNGKKQPPRTDALHWQLFIKAYSQIFMTVARYFTVLWQHQKEASSAVAAADNNDASSGADADSSPIINFLTTIALLASPSQKKTMSELLSDGLSSDLEANPWTRPLRRLQTALGSSDK